MNKTVFSILLFTILIISCKTQSAEDKLAIKLSQSNMMYPENRSGI